jgi:hypothetical protein
MKAHWHIVPAAANRRDTQLGEGSLLRLSARAEGRGNISLQWLREGRPIPGAIGPSLRIQVHAHNKLSRTPDYDVQQIDEWSVFCDLVGSLSAY